MKKRKETDYTEEEAQRRFDAALRGAFSTPPKPMKEMPRKRPKRRRQSQKKSVGR
jgi:hypothetical protein